MQRNNTSKRIQRLSALIRKEFTQLLRDRRSLVYILGLPLIELFLFSYSVSLTVYHLPTAIVDQSKDRKSREFIDALVNSQYFEQTLTLQSEEEAIEAIDAGKVKAGVVIPPRFAATTDQGTASVLILLDGSDSFGVQSGYSAAATVTQNYSLGLITAKVMHSGTAISTASSSSLPSASGIGTLPIDTSTRVLYNPDMIDVWFVLPGIVGLILQSLAVQQAAIVVVKERELGTIEQILVTPTRPLELIVSKMVPLVGLCLVAIGIVLGVGVFWFKVPFMGNLLLYIGLSLLFIASSLGLGLFISARARTQKQAQQMSLMIFMFSTLLSGMIYPRAAMPAIPQFIGDLLPLSYFIRLSRGVFTKGVGLNFVWTDALVLAIYALLVALFAARNFKKRLD